MEETLVKSFLNEKGVIAFVGSGPSVDQGLHSWEKLLEIMLSNVATKLNNNDIKAVKQHIKKKDYLLVADYLRTKMSDGQFSELIYQEFNSKVTGRIHKAILSLPNLQGIITSNYDLLLYYAGTVHQFDIPFTWNDPDLLTKSLENHFILHVHGIFKNSDSIILSSSDYTKLRFSDQAIQLWECLKNLFLNYRILFIGYSLHDPDLELFLTEIKYKFRGNIKPQFILIPKDNPAYDPLEMHSFTQRNLIPIFIETTPSIGDATLQWLENLRREIITAQTAKNITLKSSEKIFQADLTHYSESISLLMEPLILYMSEKYPSDESITAIHDLIKITKKMVSTKDPYKYWYTVIMEWYNNSSSSVFRNAIVALTQFNSGCGLLRRILSHLS